MPALITVNDNEEGNIAVRELMTVGNLIHPLRAA